MRRISFTKNNRSNNQLQIETDDCLVAIEVGLIDRDGNNVTAITIIKDYDDSKYEKEIYELDGCSFNRVIKKKDKVVRGE